MGMTESGHQPHFAGFCPPAASITACARGLASPTARTTQSLSLSSGYNLSSCLQASRAAPSTRIMSLAASAGSARSRSAYRTLIWSVITALSAAPRPCRRTGLVTVRGAVTVMTGWILRMCSGRRRVRRRRAMRLRAVPDGGSPIGILRCSWGLSLVFPATASPGYRDCNGTISHCGA